MLDQSPSPNPVLDPGLELSPQTARSPRSEPFTDYDLYLRLQRDRDRRTFAARQYATHPFRLSNVFRLDPQHPERAYCYIMNTSPGLMAGDHFRLGIHLHPGTQLYLTDQSATKVHRMPVPDSQATVNYALTVDADASLEWVPEPLILFGESTLDQHLTVTLHPTGRLFLCEAIVPGRLARQEFYQFHRYTSRWQIRSPDGHLLMGEAMRLEGQGNPFPTSPLFASLPIIATAIAIYPDVDLQKLTAECDRLLYPADPATFTAGYTVLPNCNGVMIRAMGDRISRIQTQFAALLGAFRHLSGQPSLPEIPK